MGGIGVHAQGNDEMIYYLYFRTCNGKVVLFLVLLARLNVSSPNMECSTTPTRCPVAAPPNLLSVLLSSLLLCDLASRLHFSVRLHAKHRKFSLLPQPTPSCLSSWQNHLDYSASRRCSCVSFLWTSIRCTSCTSSSLSLPSTLARDDIVASWQLVFAFSIGRVCHSSGTYVHGQSLNAGVLF